MSSLRYAILTLPVIAAILILPVCKAGAQEISVTSNRWIDIPNGSPPMPFNGTNFGEVDINNDVQGVLTVTIVNRAFSSSLTVSSVQISGTNASDFFISSQPVSPVVSGGFNNGSTSFELRFNPSAAGDRIATISFTSNDADEGSYSFIVGGIGVDGSPSPKPNLVIEQAPKKALKTKYDADTLDTTMFWKLRISNIGAQPIPSGSEVRVFYSSDYSLGDEDLQLGQIVIDKPFPAFSGKAKPRKIKFRGIVPDTFTGVFYAGIIPPVGTLDSDYYNNVQFLGWNSLQ